MMRTCRWLMGAVLCLPLAAGGCVRSSDGTVTIPRQVDMRRIWDRGPSPPQTPPLRSGATVFPVAPAAHAANAPMARAVPRRHSRKPPEAAARTPPLACREANGADGRIRVLCR